MPSKKSAREPSIAPPARGKHPTAHQQIATQAKSKDSKHNQILALLRRKQGASLAEMQTVSSWQPHSVRGFLAGTIKKRLNLKLTSGRGKDGVRRYAVPAR